MCDHTEQRMTIKGLMENIKEASIYPWWMHQERTTRDLRRGNLLLTQVRWLEYFRELTAIGFKGTTTQVQEHDVIIVKCMESIKALAKLISSKHHIRYSSKTFHFLIIQCALQQTFCTSTYMLVAPLSL